MAPFWPACDLFPMLLAVPTYPSIPEPAVHPPHFAVLPCFLKWLFFQIHPPSVTLQAQQRKPRDTFIDLGKKHCSRTYRNMSYISSFQNVDSRTLICTQQSPISSCCTRAHQTQGRHCNPCHSCSPSFPAVSSASSP